MSLKPVKVIAGFVNPMTIEYSKDFVKKAFMQIRCFSSHKPNSNTYYYDVLGLTPHATHAQIKKSFYKLSKLYHPDVSSNESSVKLFQEAAEAYEVLGNKPKRRLYDRGVLSPFRQPGRQDPSEDTFQSQEGFKAKHRHPPRGRMHTFDFDEFYRQHYGNLRKRSKEEKHYREYVEQQQEASKRSDQIVFSFLGGILIGLIFLAKKHKSNKR